MNFKINNDTYEIKEIEANELKEMYEKETQEKAYYVFGVTQKSKHVIYINKEMCEEQKLKTLKHELTHCYIWEYGLYNVMDINEETICDIVACSNDFINEIVEKYIQDKQVCHVENKKWEDLSEYEKELIMKKVKEAPLQIVEYQINTDQNINK